MTQSPVLSVVVIGRNEGERLVRCLESVRAMRSVGGDVELIYVDSDSTDGSAARAAELGARVVEVHPERPSAALGRNAGWRSAKAPHVLFLDGDTILDPDFAVAALARLAEPGNERVAAVWGHRREIDVAGSVYNRVLDLDWIHPPGDTAFCGGDALMRRAALEEVSGYDERLIAGEEPDLCRRLRARGWRIRHVDRPMTGHDLAIRRWSQYWRRAVRTGHAYAEIAERFRDTAEPLWSTEVRRNRVHAAVLVTAALGGPLLALLLGEAWPLAASFGFLTALVLRSAWKAGAKSSDGATRLLYAVHSHVQQIPILVGQLQYGLDRRAGRTRGLIEYKEANAKAHAKPRLAYLVSQYPAVSHTFVLREVRALRAAGFDIHVASINAPDRPRSRLADDEAEEAARTFYVKQSGAAGALRAHAATLATRPLGWLRGLVRALRLGGTDLAKLLYGLFYFTEAVMIGRWMRAQGLRHLHVHFATPASTVGLVLTKVFPVTLSITVHGPDEFDDAPGYRLAEKIAGASFLCCIGTFARSQLMKLSPVSEWCKFELSPLGVDADAFPPRDPDAARSERSEREAFEILCVGRLVPAKGQHVLIAALERLVAAGRNVRLRLVGDGPDRTSLEEDVARRGLADRVVFEGAVNPDRVRERYARADVFALASFAEGIPVVLMEAMAMELPCVTTCITGIPELIRNEVDGLLVSPSDDEALASALARLMDDRELARRLGHQGRRRVREKYDLARNVARLSEIFERRLGAGEPA